MTVVIGSSDEPAPTEICPNAINEDDPAVPEQRPCSTEQTNDEEQKFQQQSQPQQSHDAPQQQSHTGEVQDKQSAEDSKSDGDGKQDGKDGADNDKEHSEEAALVDPDSFPEDDLQKLEEMINRSRWVVPVLPSGELEVLLLATLRLARRGIDEQNELCMRFIRDGLTTSFVKILTDEAVSGWKFEIHKCIYHNCVLLIELCVAKLDSNCPELLDLLALLFNPDNKFHHYNASRGMDTQESTPFAKSGDARSPKGWLVNLINRFGALGGFEVLLRRFEETSVDKPLPLSIIVLLVKPFGQCCQFLTKQTISTYLMPIVEKVPVYLHKFSDEQLKKDTKNDSLSMLVRWLRYIASCAGQTAMVERLEEFRLQMLLKLLQISSFNGKMNALNEVNKAITNVMLYRQSGHGQRCVDASDAEYLTSNKMVGWIRDNNVLSIVLRDSLHQPQYVEKLEKILRFMIKEKALTLSDLDAIWDSQSGATRHEAIVKNIHDLLAKLAWDFSPEQLEHVFESCFKKSWATAQTKKEREKLIELIRRLAEDDKDGMMAHKVLQLLWGLAHNQQVPNEIVDLALSAHLKILDYSCCQDRSAQKQHWLEECVQELRNNDIWVIPALKHIREICVLYQETQQQTSHGLVPRGASQGPARSDIISALQNKHTLVVLVTTNLVNYVEESKKFVTTHPDPSVAREGHRYPHNVNVYERLRFLRFLLKDGQLWLCAPQATQIWKCLAENGAYPSDREACFNWFAKLMGDEPDLDPDINKQFFEENVLKFDPSQLTESGIHCFHRFFKMVNVKEGNLVTMKSGMSASPNGTNVVYVDNVELVGQDYLWKVVLLAPDKVSARAAGILRDTTTNLGPKLHEARTALHEEFVTTCFDRIRLAYGAWKRLQPSERAIELRKMRRLLRLLTQYVQQCDGDYPERLYLPLHRALRGREMRATIQIWSSSGTSNNSTGANSSNTSSASNSSGSSDEIVVSTHTNETLFSLKRKVEHRLEMGKLELFHGEESLSEKMHNSMGAIFPTARMTLRAKAAVTTQSLGLTTSTGAGEAGAHQSSPASSSSSESESPSPPQLSHASQMLLENQLPGVLIARKENRVRFCLTLCDIPELHDVTWALLQQIPSSSDVMAQLKQYAAGEPGKLAAYFKASSSISELQYNLEVLYAMLLPATDPLSEEALTLQCNCIRSGVLHALADMLLKRPAGAQPVELPHSVQLVLLKLYRFLLAILIRNSSSAVAAAEPHEDSVVSTVAGKVVAALQGQQFTIKPLCPSAVESILSTLVKSSWSLANLDEISPDNVHICQESLYTLTASLRLLSDAKITSGVLQNTEYIFYLLLKCPNASVRQAAEDTFYNLGKQFGPLNFITSLYAQVNGDVVTHHEKSSEYFSLIGRLLGTLKSFSEAKDLFEKELSWLRAAKDDAQPPQLTEGHLIVAISVCRFLSSDEKARHNDFVRELLEDFVFPASKAFVALKNPELMSGHHDQNAADHMEIGKLKPNGNHGQLLASEGVTAKSVCVNASITNAALDLVVELCCRCLTNLAETNRILSYMFYSDKNARITEWEYFPAVGPRPPKGFVGLKNAGATCYMNSVLQQLYMIKPIRQGLLSLKDVVTESDLTNGGNESDYNLGVLKQVMIIFGFLEKSRQQFYVPQGFWNHFRLWGEPVNVREQHDALEFFNCLVDSIDEALKSLNWPTILSKVLGGTFADQKICKGCPHRYSREESFTTLNIDIRNHSNLLDSLEQYVKGDLLEGPNAYHCEQCSKKVDTVKRLCIKSLPPILAIQLKRFDYDWDRECAIKFNDYFEFPRDLDMEPYTVQGLARREGEPVEPDRTDRSEQAANAGTIYELSGIVVHSGQASGGHYYSYIKTDGQWYKFDDGEVCESKMESHEEMKNQCFGGDYVSEMFDHISKRMSCRRQKRWWNAYILFYERVDLADRIERQLRIERPDEMAAAMLPPAIEMSVWQQNLQYTHVHVQFTAEFFRFVKNLVSVNAKHLTMTVAATDDSGDENHQEAQVVEVPDVPLLSMQLADKFLFSTYFHTKKVLRGNMSEWLATLIEYFNNSLEARTWFGQRLTNVSLPGHGIICTYLLECPVEEVRHCFAHLLANLVHCLLKDTPNQSSDFNPLAVRILSDVMQLLAKDVCDYGRHVNHYFLFYSLYAGMGSREKMHLIKSEVPLAFIRLALDDGAIKYQYAELGKLYQTIATLLHCLDVTGYQAAADESRSLNLLLANPYARSVLAPMDERIAEYLFQPNSFIKKLLEDANGMDEVVDLVKYLCWENQEMSRNVLTELLWCIAYVCTYEVRPYLDILLHILTIQDSWQMIRINMILKGMRPDREALFDIIERAKSHYQKRAYQCVKFLVELLTRVPEAFEDPETRQRLQAAVEWTRTELDRKHYPGSGQQQPPWSQVSNETSNGYFLERSASAVEMVSRAGQLLAQLSDGEEQPHPAAAGDTAANVASTAGAGCTATTTITGATIASTLSDKKEADPWRDGIVTTTNTTGKKDETWPKDRTRPIEERQAETPAGAGGDHPRQEITR
ncbi:probable ubiquitin carboxyl-terminal hydrolase FAF-X isoform X2 [Varroa jacobsoni]|uniref:ubiquitinyl hydrolase 1 n=1 Tax=Varroa destructor TaxID=109461 RepID=A0A7M7J0L0_VARDE|nr:probable ubiquitin carboxyl-terminal hydrolase FAF-X isoform X2 [Varroa destructor]XP_022644954.1 probable ubiquitin carboxyl-terminal hydrolase FAF-X isoform X2 [Varroa destructor]XP_022701235.1 probable ubiquitin carboxyl-terminal hydrolase FAF-X isoform X2 [Varroa jacobsoni]XP_022701245.1 probable ubiquitin carboxyl-terminal hydrolase FAF-X isoform X2 [Varroa jacobsoni]